HQARARGHDMIRRRSLIAGAAAAGAAAPVRAESWPSRPLRLVVPCAAGAGNVGAEIVAKAPPDGYTFMIGNQALLVSPFLFAHMGYDPLNDLLPVTMVNSAPLMLVVHPALPVKSVKEFIAYARANPGKLNYGSGGVGSTPFLAVESLKSVAGFDAVHVPYKGGGPALADLIAGQLAFMIENVPGTLPYVKDGKLRALAITSAKRSPLVPELPTMQEAGIAGYEMVGWNGIFVPKGTPADITNKLHGALAKILHAPDVQAQMTKLGADAVGDSREHFAAFVKGESERWGKIIRDKGIKPE